MPVPLGDRTPRWGNGATSCCCAAATFPCRTGSRAAPRVYATRQISVRRRADLKVGPYEGVFQYGVGPT